MAKIDFDSTTVEPNSAYEPLPAADYLVVVTDSDVKQTKTGTGEYLQVTLEVIEGKFKGRKIFDRLNIRNSNATAQTIGQQQLSGLCRACNVSVLEESEQLHDIPLTVRLSIEDGKGDYGPQNRVKLYSRASAAKEEKAESAAPVAAANVPAWKRAK
jgi:hypothetical protein